MSTMSSTMDSVAVDSPTCLAGLNHHALLLFRARDAADLVVCSTPKVGSLLLREANVAMTQNKSWRPVLNTRYVHSRLTLLRKDQLDYLRSPLHTRLMWVRHPVARILSGWVTVATDFHHVHQRNLTGMPTLFEEFVRQTLAKHYDPNCHGRNRVFDHSPSMQHFLPPQHCRCGLH